MSLKIADFLKNKSIINAYTKSTNESKSKFISIIRKNYFVINSNTNFIHICPKNFKTNEIFQLLKKNSFATRITSLINTKQHTYFKKKNILWLRITIGPKIDKNKLFINLLNNVTKF